MRSFNGTAISTCLPAFKTCLVSIFAAVSFLGSASAAPTLSPATIRSNVISFAFDSAPDQLLAVQSGTSLATEWVDLAYFRGTGTSINFSAPATGTRRFFRVRATPFKPLDLSPNAPTLAGGAVSLQDAVVGETHSEYIFPALSGLPPYAMQTHGQPPDGVTLVITSNHTGNASVQIVSTGAVLVSGQRRQFAVTVMDSLNATKIHSYDLRVIAPPPQIPTNMLVLKAGEAVNAALVGIGGTEPLSGSLVSGALPADIDLSPDGRLAGTPTADAAELNENGIRPTVIEVADSLTDRVTGAPAPRKATNTVRTLVRLSYRLNIQATRDNGPTLQATCLVCHGSGFKPNFEGTALDLVNVNSGSGFLCGTSRVYIAPGDTSNSLIYQKLSNPPCGERMPFSGPYFSDQRLERLGRWVRELTTQDTD